MAKTRKPKNQNDEAIAAAVESPLGSEPAQAEAPEEAETTQPLAAVIEAPAAGADAAEEGESAPLENAGEMEDESAVVIDGDLSTLLTTPLGLRGAIETLLFISPEPLTTRRIGNVLDLRDSRLVLATVKQLQAEYDNERRGLAIVESAEGFQMATREVYGDLVLRLKGRRRRPPLSPTALETLSIIAYRQPVIRAEIEAIRGVESSGAIRNLIDMGLVEMTGRKDVLGRPPMYGTTAQFLQAFSLKDLSELPPIGELKRQIAEAVKISEAEEQAAMAVQRGEESQRLLEISDGIRQKAEAEAQSAEPETAPSENESIEELSAVAEILLDGEEAEEMESIRAAAKDNQGPEDEEDEDEDEEAEDGDDEDDEDEDDDDDDDDNDDDDEDEDEDDDDDDEDEDEDEDEDDDDDDDDDEDDDSEDDE